MRPVQQRLAELSPQALAERTEGSTHANNIREGARELAEAAASYRR